MNFLNFETQKLFIPNPVLSNTLIFVALVCIAGITFVRQKSIFLDRVQTDQLKGIAILFVVTGHLWSHVSFDRNVLNFAGYAVALFLLLSGYGLTRSWQRKPLTASEFARRRIGRVMVPYWITTICILSLDYWLLDKQYSFVEICLTFCGLNFKHSLRYLDYARWYITLILIFYCVFFLANRLLRPLAALLSLFLFSFSLFIFRRMNIFPFGGLFHFVAFPLGCLIGYLYTPDNVAFINRKLPLTILLSVTFLGALLCNKIITGLNGSGAVVKLLRLFFSNAQPILFCVLLITVFGLLGTFKICSRFFLFCGIVSYEIYLLHGPLLIKYNPVFPYFSSDSIVVGYLVFLLFILALSYLFKLFHEYFYRQITVFVRRR